MDHAETSVYQQIKKSCNNKYFIELACFVSVLENIGLVLFFIFPSLWTSPAGQSINLRKKNLNLNTSPLPTKEASSVEVQLHICMGFKVVGNSFQDFP